MAFNPFKHFGKDKQDSTPLNITKEHLTEEVKVKPTPSRGAGGKFVSTKKKQVLPITEDSHPQPVKAVEKKEEKNKKDRQSEVIETTPITVSFYGADIRKIYHGSKWYFATEDILSLAKPATPGGEVKVGPAYEKTLKEVTLKIDGVSYADASGNMKLVQDLQASFPGPLSRWLEELSKMPYVPENP